MSKQLHATIPDEVDAALSKESEQTGAPVAEIVRRALRHYLAGRAAQKERAQPVRR